MATTNATLQRGSTLHTTTQDQPSIIKNFHVRILDKMRARDTKIYQDSDQSVDFPNPLD